MEILSTSDCRASTLERVLMGLYKMSLVWKMREESCDREMVVRGFMLMENSRGPRMEPLGTLEVTA